MSGASFIKFFNGSKPFGLNVVSNGRGGATSSDSNAYVKRQGPLEPLFNFLQENEKVFNGDIQAEQNKLFAASFNIGARMQEEDRKVNGAPPKFNISF